jgi:hypothetical protein
MGVARMDEVSNVYTIFVGKREGRRPLGRHGHRWEDNMIRDRREIWWQVVVWVHLAQDRDQ